MAACERGGASDPDQIERELFAGDAILWIANDGPKIIAAGATQLWINGSRKVCSIIALGGIGLSGYRRHMHAMIEEYAKRAHCDVIEVCGRMGWARVLKGYEIVKVIEGDTRSSRRVIMERSL